MPAFSDITVTWAEVAATLATSIEDPAQQDAIILEATEDVQGRLEDYAIDLDNLPEGSLSTLKTVILRLARLLVRQYDSSSGSIYAVTEVREAHDTIKFAGRSGSDLQLETQRLLDRLLSWIRKMKADSFFTYGAFNHYEEVQ